VLHVGLCIFIGNLNATAALNMILHLAASIPATLICRMEEQKEKSHFATAMAIRFASKVSFVVVSFVLSNFYVYVYVSRNV